MSKRFGRNQRRRAREEAARLGAALDTMSRTVESIGRTADGHRREAGRLRSRAVLLETQIKAAQQVFGESIALPPPELVLDSKEFRDACDIGLMRMRRLEFGRSYSPTSHESKSEAAARSFEVMTLDVIEGGIDLLGRGGLHSVPHAYLTCKSRGLAYAVFLDGLAQLHRPEAVNRLAHVLAAEFMDTLERVRR
jgi:hypothetical protein